VAAALSIQDPRERPVEQRAQADQAHARFADPASDFLTYLNLWQYVRDAQRDLSGSAFRRLCRSEYLNWLRLREWQDVVTQLKELAKPLGITVNPPRRTDRDLSAGSADHEDPATAARGSLRLEWDADRIHVALLSGLLSQIGMQEASDLSGGSPQRGRGRQTG